MAEKHTERALDEDGRARSKWQREVDRYARRVAR